MANFLDGLLQTGKKKLSEFSSTLNTSDLIQSLGRAGKLAISQNLPSQQINRQIAQNLSKQVRDFGTSLIEQGQFRKESLPVSALRSSAGPALTLAGGVISGLGRGGELASDPRRTVETFRKAPTFTLDSLGNYDKPSKVSLALDIGLPTMDVSDMTRYGLMGLIASQGVKSTTSTATKGKAVLKSANVVDDIIEGFGTARTAQKSRFAPSELRAQFLDKLTPIFDLVKRAPQELPAETNPYKRMRLYAGLSGKVGATLEQGLGPVLRKEVQRLPDLSALLTLERNQELIGRGIKTRYSQAEVNKGIASLAQRYGQAGFDSLSKSARQIRTYANSLLEELGSSGVISPESLKAIRENNQYYVPFQVVEHISDNVEKGNFARTSFNIASQDVIKAIKGSDKQIADPIESLVKRTSQVIALSDRNRAMQSLVNLRNVDDVFKDFIKPLKNEAVPKGFEKISLFENGKNVDYAVTEDINRAIKGLDKQSNNVLVEVVSWQAKILRAGATGFNIGFIPANIVRDFSDAMFSEFTEKGVKGITDFLGSYPQAVASAFKKDDVYQYWLKSGGAQSSLTEQIIKATDKTVNTLAGIREGNLKGNIKYMINSSKDLITFVNRVGEQSTRLARFKSGLKAGETPLEAAYKSRDITVDFAKSGNAIKIVNQVVPFLNANIQGTERFFRLAKDNPKKAAVAIATLTGFPAVMLYLHNSQFADYKDIPQFEKDENWIIISNDRTEAERVSEAPIHGVKIPKGFFSQLPANITESFLDFLNSGDPDAVKSWALRTLNDISPVGQPFDEEGLRKMASTGLPPAFKAGIEQLTNQNLFTGAPVIPRSQEKLEPRFQTSADTPEILNKIGQTLNVSPRRMESVLSTTMGGVGSQIPEILSGNIKKGTLDQITRRFFPIREQATQKEKDYEVLDELTTVKATLDSGNIPKEGSENLRNYATAEWITAKINSISDQDEKLKAYESLQEKGLISDEVARRLILISELEGEGLKRADRELLLYDTKGLRAEKVLERLDQFQKPETKGDHFDLLVEAGIIDEDIMRRLILLRAVESSKKKPNKLLLPN